MGSVSFLSIYLLLLLDLDLILTPVAVDIDVSCSSTGINYNEPVTQDDFIVIYSTVCFMDKDKTVRALSFFICDSGCKNCSSVTHCFVNTANCKDNKNKICNCQKKSEKGNVQIYVKVPIPDTDQCLLGQLYNNTSLLNITKLLKVENDNISPVKDEKDTTEGSTSPGKVEKDTTEGSTSSGKDEKVMTEGTLLVMACIISCLGTIIIGLAVRYCRKQCWKYQKPICFCNQKQVCQHLGEKDEGDYNNELSLKHEDTEPTTTFNDRRGESAEPEDIGSVERQRRQQIFKIKDLREESEFFKLEDENDNANNDCAVTSRPNLNENTTIHSREAYDVSINV